MFAREKRFRDDESRYEANRSNYISEMKGLETGERLMEWGKHLQEKLAERSMYVKRCKEEEERQLLRPKHLSSDELEAVGERLYEDMEKLQLTRKQRLNKEKTAKLIRESKELEHCTFRPKLYAAPRGIRVESRYLSPQLKKASVEIDEPTFVPEINTAFFIPPKEKNVFKRLYHDQSSRTEPEQQEPTSRRSSGDFESFLKRQELYQYHRQEHMEELKDLYDYPFTPMLSDRTRQISDKIQSQPWIKHLDTLRHRRTRRVLLQHGVHKYGQSLHQLLQPQTSNSEINKALKEEAPKRKAPRTTRRLCKQEPPPEPSESDEMIPDNPQPAKTEEEAREYFEKEERLRKAKKDRNLKKYLEQLILEDNQMEEDGERKRTPRSQSCDVGEQKDGIGIDRLCRSAKTSPVSRKPSWNSSTLYDNRRVAETDTTRKTAVKPITERQAENWYKKQKRHSARRNDAIESITKKYMEENYPFQPKTGIPAHKSSNQSSLSFLERVKLSIAESNSITVDDR